MYVFFCSTNSAHNSNKTCKNECSHNERIKVFEIPSKSLVDHPHVFDNSNLYRLFQSQSLSLSLCVSCKIPSEFQAVEQVQIGFVHMVSNKNDTPIK